VAQTAFFRSCNNSFGSEGIIGLIDFIQETTGHDPFRKSFAHRSISEVGRKQEMPLFQSNTAYSPKADENLRVQKPRRIGANDPVPF
jgi:hypothetical protein